MILINPYRFGGPALLLDTYTGATAAYSLRKLRTAYTGYCIKARRSSDNAEQDIGFVNNVLDESSLTSFCGAGDGFIHTWYDQAGSKNVTQTTISYQPKIVVGGSILKEGSKPCIQWYDYATLQNNFGVNYSQPITIFSVAKNNNPLNIGAAEAIFDSYSSDNRAMLYHQSNQTEFRLYTSFGVMTGMNDNGNLQLFVVLFNSTASKLYINASSSGTLNPGTGTFDPLSLGTGRSGGAMYWYGILQEFIMYASNKTTDIPAMQTAINSFYSIY